MITQVVNLHHAPYNAHLGRSSKNLHRIPNLVYIGHGSRWGNKHRIGRDGDRQQVIRLYEGWLRRQVDSGAITLSDLAALHGQALGCYCAPLDCHGHVLARWAQVAYETLYGVS